MGAQGRDRRVRDFPQPKIKVQVAEKAFVWSSCSMWKPSLLQWKQEVGQEFTPLSALQPLQEFHATALPQILFFLSRSSI